MKTNNFYLAYLGGVIMALTAVFFISWASDVDYPKAHYQQNVCQYLGGEVHDNICIVNGKVITVPIVR